MTISQTPFQQYGGKWEFGDWYASLLPRAQTLVITHFGAGSPLWHIDPYPVEVINDLDGGIVNFFRVCRDYPSKLARAIDLTPYSRREYELCSHTEGGDIVEQARRFAYVARASHGGEWGRSWSRSKGHSRRGMSSSVSRYLHLPETTIEIADRIKTTQIECLDGTELILQYDREDAVFFIDPPYMPETRKGADVYAHEMSVDQHEEMLKVLKGTKGRWLLCGYANPMYSDMLSEFSRLERVVNCRSNVTSDGTVAKAPTRVETVWANYNLCPSTHGTP